MAVYNSDPIIAEENIIAATFTADLFSTVDGVGPPQPGSWGGYWDKQGPELLDHRLALYGEEQRMVFGANTTYRLFVRFARRCWVRARRPRRWVTLGSAGC